MYIDDLPATVKPYWLKLIKYIESKQPLGSASVPEFLRSHLETEYFNLLMLFSTNPEDIGSEKHFTKLTQNLMFNQTGGPFFQLIFDMDGKRLIIRPAKIGDYIRYLAYVVDTTKYVLSPNENSYVRVPYTQKQLHRYMYEMLRYINDQKIIDNVY